MKLRIRVATVGLATILSGCTIFWPGGFQVQRADREMFEVWYDPLLAHPGALDEAAKKHCETYGLASEISKTQHGAVVVSNKIWYRCIPKK
jgi:hypothetical protein